MSKREELPPSASEALTPPPAEAVARFRRDVDNLVRCGLDGARLAAGERLALAVSGGPDSMAMLLLAAAAFPGDITVATFDHRLRDSSAAEVEMVAAFCARLGVAHRALYPSEAITGSSLQQRARESRYAALADWARGEDIYPLLTAHHADDQAETLLMRLNRGSGVAGLSGIRPIRFAGGVMILRPLLGWRRDEMRRIAVNSQAPWVDDPSNSDDRHDRTWFRALLAANPGLDPVALARSAAIIGEANDVIVDLAETAWAERWSGPDRPFVVDDLPREVRRRLVRRAITDTRRLKTILLPVFGDASNVEPLLDAMEEGRTVVQGGVMVRWRPGGWRFSPAPPRRAH